MPAITKSAIGRALLFAQYSARPWRLSPKVALDEMRTFAASASFDALLYILAYVEAQKGAPLGLIKHPLVINRFSRQYIGTKRLPTQHLETNVADERGNSNAKRASGNPDVD